MVSDEGTGKDARGYIGEYQDTTGLSYLNARYYDASRGQFLSEDPIFWGKQNLENPQSFNSYAYANGNPITGKDPSGKFAGIDDAILMATAPIWIPVAAVVLYYPAQDLFKGIANFAQHERKQIFVGPRQISNPLGDSSSSGDDLKPPKDNAALWKKAVYIGLGVGYAATQFAEPFGEKLNDFLDQWKEKTDNKSGNNDGAQNEQSYYRSPSISGVNSNTTSYNINTGGTGAGQRYVLPNVVTQNGITYYRNSSGLLSSTPGH